MTIQLSEERFAELVHEAIRSLPDEFADKMENVSVEIQSRPSRELIASIGARPRMRQRLLGLYRGVPLTRKSVSAPWDLPELIYIFQRNVESACNDEVEIVQRVRQTVLHEIGHHFGMSEEDLDELGFG